jgi:hypothetical protein
MITEDSNHTELKCSEVAHVFDDHSEICKCGKVPRHRVIKCPTCKREHWSERAQNPKVETERI